MRRASKGRARLALVTAVSVTAFLVTLAVGPGTGAGASTRTTATARNTTTPQAATADTPPGFGSPTVVDPTHAYGEPDVKIAPNGDVHDSGPWGTGTQRSIWN